MDSYRKEAFAKTGFIAPQICLWHEWSDPDSGRESVMRLQKGVPSAKGIPLEGSISCCGDRRARKTRRARDDSIK